MMARNGGARFIAAAVVTAALVSLFPAQLVGQGDRAKKIPRVGILWSGPPATPHPNLDALREGLRALGYVEGQTVVLDELYGMERAQRFEDFAAELVSRGVTILVTSGPLTSIAAQRMTKTIPIVFVAVHSPVELGLISSLGHPGGNITGVAWNVGPELQAKQLELLKSVVPHLERVAFLYGDLKRPEAPAYVGAMDAGARYLGLKLQIAPVADPQEYDAAFRAIVAQRAEALAVAGNGRNFIHRKRILEFAARNRLPSAFAWKEAVEDGGLVSYRPDIPSLFGRAAVYVDKILKGAKPADLPVEQPTKFELAINLKTAKRFGLTVPKAMLMQADRALE